MRLVGWVQAVSVGAVTIDRPSTKSHRAESAGLGLAGAVFVDLRLARAKNVTVGI